MVNLYLAREIQIGFKKGKEYATPMPKQDDEWEYLNRLNFKKLKDSDFEHLLLSEYVSLPFYLLVKEVYESLPLNGRQWELLEAS